MNQFKKKDLPDKLFLQKLLTVKQTYFTRKNYLQVSISEMQTEM